MPTLSTNNRYDTTSPHRHDHMRGVSPQADMDLAAYRAYHHLWHAERHAVDLLFTNYKTTATSPALKAARQAFVASADFMVDIRGWINEYDTRLMATARACEAMSAPQVERLMSLLLNEQDIANLLRG